MCSELLGAAKAVLEVGWGEQGAPWPGGQNQNGNGRASAARRNAVIAKVQEYYKVNQRLNRALAAGLQCHSCPWTLGSPIAAEMLPMLPVTLWAEREAKCPVCCPGEVLKPSGPWVEAAGSLRSRLGAVQRPCREGRHAAGRWVLSMAPWAQWLLSHQSSVPERALLKGGAGSSVWFLMSATSVKLQALKICGE